MDDENRTLAKFALQQIERDLKKVVKTFLNQRYLMHEKRLQRLPNGDWVEHKEHYTHVN